MKKSLFTLLAIMIFSSVYSQKVTSVVATVDLKRYQGKWY